ncbi:MAG TPA: ATP-binding protein [Polyangiaceae bacterium]
MNATKPSPIRVLFVEDNPDDVELELLALRQAGLVVEHRTVETRADLLAALAEQHWDLILCDYWMPELSGLSALKVAKEVAPAIPFILVSGTVGEDLAVDAMRAGAEDYVLKANLRRLASAAQRELRDAERKQAGVLSDKALRLFADVGAAVGKTLDREAIVAAVPALVVRDFGELCVIDLLDDSGTFRRAASAHADPDKAELLRRLDAENASHESIPHRARGALESSSHLVLDSFEGQTPPGIQGAFVEISRHLALTCALSVPMIAESRVVGAIHLARRARYSPLEVRIIREFATRVAVAVENALLYERAQRAVQIRDEFLSIASHELRTPVAVLQLEIQSLAELAGKKAEEWGDESLTRRIQRSTQSVARMAQLVEVLLDVSHISAGRLQLALDAFELSAMVRDIVERFQSQAKRTGCEIAFRATALVRGAWDRLRLEQVLMNLLSNSIKYGAGRPIEVEVADSGEYALVSVVDHGIGIAPEDLERVFGRFERAVSSRHYGGLGLGLFIARRIVEAHGGTVSAEATPAGGATFRVALPKVPPGAGATV